MAQYQKQTIRFGVGGLDLRRSPDLVDVLNAQRLTNAIRLPDGGWTSRFGQTALATSAYAPLHSVARATDPQSSTTKFLWGGSTRLLVGTTGVLSSLATGFSGNPLSMVPWRVTQSGESWMIVGDSSKMVKVRVSDGLVLPLGLPVPTTPTTALASANTKTIDDFTAGFTSPGYAATPAGGLPVSTYVAADWVGAAGNCLNLATVVGAATAGYASYTDKALNLDLTTFGAITVTDDDYFHLWLRADNPAALSEVRVYFTTGAWTTGTLPGTSAAVPPVNANGYYKTFRPSDSTTILGGTPAVAAAPTILQRRLADDGTKIPLTQDETTAVFQDPTITTGTSVDNSQTPSSQQVPGNSVWTEWASVGIPLRRGDFQPIGETPDWSKVKGLTIYVSTNSASVVNVRFDSLYLLGGAGPDTGEPGTKQYDYVATNYDPRTGAESNGSVVQADTLWLDALRTGITIDPAAYGDAAVRQRFYRRGGTLSNNWYFVGVNTSDGGTFTDTLTDTSLVDAATAPTDYFQAVPSTLANGTASLAKAVPYVWGPLQGLVFAAGDSNRPGSVYYCYPDNVDAWGANGYVDVSAPSEAIIGGFLLGSQAFAWSTQRLYALNINLSDSTSVYSTITNCTRAPIAPWAHVVGQGLDWFVSFDGIFATDGGIEQTISDNWIRPLFQGQSANGLAPIDFTVTTALRLTIYQNELHFFYQDVNGARQSLIYHLFDKLWRHASYAIPVSVAYTDLTTGIGRLIMGSSNGNAYTYAGTSDDGTAIGVTIQTGAYNQGYQKSQKRYSDFTIDANANGNVITVTPYYNYDQATTTPLTIPADSGRQPYIYSFTPDPLLSTTLGLRMTWSSAVTPPTLYSGDITLEVEPSTMTRWTSLPTDHGLPGWSMATMLMLSLRSNADLTLTVTSVDQVGSTSTTTYTIPSTGFAKQKRWVPFVATKGAMYTYQLSSAVPFVLYPDESTIRAQAWGSDGTAELKLIQLGNEGTTSFDAYTSRAALTPGGQ